MVTVLVIDDEPDLVHMVSLSLLPEGYKVMVANDGASALRLIHAELPDLVLVDWQMPGMDGVAFCKAVRSDADSRIRDVPILMLTGRTGAEARREALEAGVTDYLTKAVGPAQIRSRVRKWLGSPTAGSD
jgi:DNA-binding response OmpR family regulator